MIGWLASAALLTLLLWHAPEPVPAMTCAVVGGVVVTAGCARWAVGR